MLTSKPTKKQIEEWKKLYGENRSKLKPNRKSGIEVDEYFRSRYRYENYDNKEFEEAVAENVLSNDFNRKKLKDGKMPTIRSYAVGDVYVGIDTVSGYVHVESENTARMELVRDDLVLFRGLDENDLQNFFLVAEYVQLHFLRGLKKT